jgi:hypothetical protein
MTGKKPAVALIVNDNDQRYINRLNTIAKKLNIKTIIIQRD